MSRRVKAAQYAAAVCSFTGLIGVYHIQAWGPFVCGVASTAWFAIAVTTRQYPWGAVELAYALSNFAIALRWGTR